MNPKSDDCSRLPHLLLVTPYYWPEIAASVQLMQGLAEGLTEHQFRVTVLTSSTREPIPTGALGHGASAKNLRIIRAWNPFSRRNGLINKLLEFAWYFLTVAVRGLFVGRVDVIFVSSSPPLAALPVAILARIKRAPVVYNLQDLFPESAVAGGMMSSTGFAFRAFTRQEKWTYTLVDLVIAISESFAVHVRTLCPSCRLAIIPNWVDSDQMAEILKKENKFLPLLSKSRPFVVLYAGNLGYLQNLDLLLDAARILEEEKDILFVFVGNGNQKADLVERVKRDKMENCVFMDFQPYDMLAHVYSACDLGVVPMRPGAGTSSIPSKTWNYLSCSKPIIACVEKDAPFAKLIVESCSGRVVSPQGAVELAQAIRELHADPGLLQEYGQAGRRYVVDYLSQRAAIASYSEALKGVLGWKK